MSLVLSRFDDNLVRSATSIVIAAGSPLTGYGTDWLASGSWAHPFKVAGTALDIRFSFATPVLPQFAALGNTNLNVAAVLQGNPSNSWISQAVSRPFGIPTRRPDGYRTSPSLDLSAEPAQSWWRLLISGNALPVILGELWLGAERSGYDGHLLDGASAELTAGMTSLATPAGVEMTYQESSPRDRLTGDFIVTVDELADLEDWIRTNGAATRPFFVASDAKDDALYVRLGTSSLLRRPLGGGFYRVSVPLAELARGESWD